MKPSDSNTILSTAMIGGTEIKPAPLPSARGDCPPAEVTDAEVRRIMKDVMARRARGEVLSDDRILSEHPDLRSQLEEELEGLRMLRHVLHAAKKAGPIDDPLEPISTADLDAPIDDPPADQVPPWDDPRAPLHVQNYRVLAEISRGGQATVFKAIQEVTGRRVAIKVLTGGALAGSRHRARFEREAQALGALDHPNVVGILDRGRTVDGSFFLVMPFIDGCPLDQYAADAQLADADFPAGLLRTFVKIAGAVHEAHRLGIIHRDLKPSNIRIDARGEPHLLDFGLARILDSDAGKGPDAPTVLTMANQVVGSLPWASPEQAGGDSAQVDARGDVYALGVCLYQCLTGRFPYPITGSMTETVRHITTTPASPLRWTTVNFPRVSDLETVLAKALAKSPKHRYATAADFAHDLEALLDDRAVTARPGLFSNRKPWLRPTLWAAVACCVTAAAWSLQRPVPVTPVTVVPLPTMSNTLNMRLVRVPAGQFWMGSVEDERNRGKDENLHQVRLTRDFWIADREVTRDQFFTIMGWVPEGTGVTDGNLPVTGVTWDDADRFCKRLSQEEGRRYRLPTEAQWEYACRAGRDDKPYAGSGSLHAMGWYAGSQGQAGLHYGGAKAPNHWGLYDFHGNAAEWCEDRYVPYPKIQELLVNPLYADSDSSQPRVIRGGSFQSPPEDCRSAARAQRSPYKTRADLGFRVIIDDSTPSTRR